MSIAQVEKFHKQKYSYIFARHGKGSTNFETSRQKYGLSESDLQSLYSDLALSTKQETSDTLGIDFDKLDTIGKQLTTSLQNTLNNFDLIQKAPAIVRGAQNREFFEKERANARPGDVLKFLEKDPRVIQFFKVLNEFAEVNEYYHRALGKTAKKHQNLREAIEATHRYKVTKDGGKWVHEVENFKAALTEGLVGHTIDNIEKEIEMFAENGKKIGSFTLTKSNLLGTDTIENTRSKGDLSWGIEYDGKAMNFIASMKTKFGESQQSSFDAVKEMNLDSVPVSENFKIALKQLRVSYAYLNGKRKDIPDDFKKNAISRLTAALLASYAFGGSANRSLSILIYKKNSSGKGEIKIDYLYEYFEQYSKSATKKKSFKATGPGFPTATADFSIDKSLNFSEALNDAKNLHMTFNVRGKLI